MKKIPKWLSVTFIPNSLFSLKKSNATTKCGFSHLIPTPYTIRVGYFATAFRVADKNFAKHLLHLIKDLDIRIRPPSHIVIQKTYIKVLQPPLKGNGPLEQTVVFREFVYLHNQIQIAFKITELSNNEIQDLIKVSYHITSIGKKDSFFQYRSHKFSNTLTEDFCSPVIGIKDLQQKDCMVLWLDEFTTKLRNEPDIFDKLSVYSDKKIMLKTDRDILPYSVPLIKKNSGKNFDYYMRM